MRLISNIALVTICTLCLTQVSLAESRRYRTAAAPHAGQVDTDGILSKGEIRNPRINYGLQRPNEATHRGEVDSDGRLSPGELRNPLIDYRDRPSDYYKNHDWDHKWDNYDEGYWRRYPERRWWNDDDSNWRRDDNFSEALREGARSGRISRREEVELKGKRADLLRAEQDYWSDGHLSKGERRDLEGRAADLRKSFDHELHDGEYR